MTFIRKLRMEEVEFSVMVEEEISKIDVDDEDVHSRILRRLDKGDAWAWCTVIVSAKWNRFKGEETLGCCSYLNEEDFKRSENWDALKVRALDDLQENIERFAERLEPLVTQESFEAWTIQKVQED